ncbi:MAG: hypothetical protein E7162_01580 [Firmicutes bacterium]|nr:hypothetical protein [Bacillota bacterium]
MKDDDLLYVLPSTAISVFASLTKSIQYPLFESRNTVLRSYSEGLYHITTDETADKIIESQEVHASSRFASYGIHKRCFFFGGVPDFENVCLNVTPGVTLTAVRVMFPYEKLAEFDRRGMNDGAITYKGDLSLEGAKVEKVRLGLKERDGELYYAPISEEEYQNYKLNVSSEKESLISNKLAFKLRSYISGMRREFDLFKENIGGKFHELINDEASGIRLPKTRKDYVEENSDLFEHTDEIPVVEINQEEQAINLYSSIIDENNNSYKLGEQILYDKNDVKAELLKSVVSNVVSSLNEGVMVNSNTVITPGMSDKDISDVIYTNICNGKIEECYNLLDNSVVLFSVCRSYIQNREKGISNDPRVQFLTQDINDFNSNLIQNKTSQMAA